jgi:hypothetical protein
MEQKPCKPEEIIAKLRQVDEPGPLERGGGAID